ncbi:hypothetical protein Q6U62_004526 [Vibrio parahaemolyticus]|uniref:hypothetical protein n=1 Tax=Vibrio parahaemolyticus TaxID=670 RepID=UPI0004227933|nr:hypothetical protein [Vibrio parahaemolyticus]EGR3325493.1 hypothetical protein [Vibrio parahaemolyticus]EGR3441831.1 hypothetical protein [Vibrio parahaemolyticus]EIO5098538.1 hypothetical protein [Vibrio parahaemolyticus]EJC1078492.1 hypothetical protein [Vibrio parahaemolyticus]EJG1032795.1 hypothetical protein [Vibrio parahaemolyticus]
MTQSNITLIEQVDTLLMDQIDIEIAEPSGYVSPRDPKDHVSLGRMKERLKKEGFDTALGIQPGLAYELACRAIKLNNTRRTVRQKIEAEAKKQQKMKDAENESLLDSAQ